MHLAREGAEWRGESTMGPERLSGTVAAIAGILVSMPETAKIDTLRAIRFADAMLGKQASAEASREAKRLIEGIVAQAKNA
jgi:hypothetical protein